MFKIGDIVEITEGSDATGMLDFKKGKGYKVLESRYWDEYTSIPQVYIKGEGDNSLGWYAASHFKLKEDIKVEKKECLFKEGQVVWDVVYGKGEVKLVCEGHRFPVEVEFQDGIRTYTDDGKPDEEFARTLYFSEPKIEAATEPLFEPVLKEGDVVLAWEREYDEDVPSIVVVKREDENTVWSTYDTGWKKSDYDFYRIGEKIVFN